MGVSRPSCGKGAVPLPRPKPPESGRAAGGLFELAAVDDLQLGPVRFCLHDRRVPLPGQILEAVGVDWRLVKLAAPEVTDIAERRVADYSPTRRLSSAPAIGAAYAQREKLNGRV
jgi:hypothetical protein